MKRVNNLLILITKHTSSEIDIPTPPIACAKSGDLVAGLGALDSSFVFACYSEVGAKFSCGLGGGGSE